MSDKKSDNTHKKIDAVTALVKEIPIYEDALQPFAKETGKALQTVGKAINLALTPIEGAVWGFEKIKIFIENKLENKLKKIPIENIQSPQLSIAGPIFESLRYLSNEEMLRDMYANLLANAMDTDTKNNAHPSFVEIIKQLSSKEASLLLFLSNQENYPNVCSYESSHILSTEMDIYFLELCSDFENTCNISSALDNYKRLRILDIESEVGQGIGPSEYGNNNQFDSSMERVYEHIEFGVSYSEKLVFTSFGQEFIESCVIDKEK